MDIHILIAYLPWALKKKKCDTQIKINQLVSMIASLMLRNVLTEDQNSSMIL